MGKQGMAIIVAVLLGFVALGLVTFLSTLLYPAPDGLDPSDAEAMRAYVEGVPLPAKLIVLASWFTGAFVAGFIAKKLAPGEVGTQSALIAGVLLMLAGIMNALNIPHPVWMMVIGLLQYIPMAYLGARVAGTR